MAARCDQSPVGPRRRRWLRGPASIVAAAVVAGLLTAPAAGGVARPDVPRCALGRLPAPLRTVIPKAIVSEEKRFVRSLSGAAASRPRRARKAFSAGVAAYVYGMPAVLVRLTVEPFPPNVLIGIGSLANPEFTAVIAPNNDNLYSTAQIDLTGGPMMIDAPQTRGRYSVLQLLDANTNVFELIGSRGERDRAETVALVPPGWRGAVPANARLVESPTRLVWVIGRTLVDGPADIAGATSLMARYALTPIADWIAGERDPELILPFAPNLPPVKVPEGLGFYDSLGEALAADRPRHDGCALKAFGRAGIGPGEEPSESAGPLLADALLAAAAAGDRVVRRAVGATRRRSAYRRGGWTSLPRDTGRFGRDFAHRAVVAQTALGANLRRETLYPVASADRRGDRLSGRHRYVVNFRGGELPPVRAFWSMTLYKRDLFLVANPIDRYAIGDRTTGLRFGRDRSLKLYVQRDRPSGARAANWLPAPKGRFHLYLRLYEPRRAAIDGRWVPPRVTRVGGAEVRSPAP